MFIGHYGPALAAKPLEKRLPLWLLFIAVQWLDVVWSGLVMLHVERLRIVKGFTQGSSLDLYYMPFTHGLLGALALSAALGAIAALFYRDRCTTIVLGLWRYLWLSFPLELASLVAGAWFYARMVPSTTRFGDVTLWLFVAVMALIETNGTFGPEPSSPIAEAETALVAYAVLAALAGAVDWARGTTGWSLARSQVG